ncbi:MAG: RNA polymerase sigma factor [Pseudomonadales bacterium]|nr:RNA polymerase sigma factor [Pseudomonadales bacterium]
MESADKLLIQQIRSGSEDAWQNLINLYEGRLRAFAQRRLGQSSAVDDIVQETLIGFLTSIPNFDENRAIQGFLFTICAHKLTDYLRREGRRPTIPIHTAGSSQGDMPIPGGGRRASTIYRSGERREMEEAALVDLLTDTIESLKTNGDWEKINCLELLLVRGMPNKQVAVELDSSQQQVASIKFEFLDKLKRQLKKYGLNEDVFPEFNLSTNGAPD